MQYVSSFLTENDPSGARDRFLPPLVADRIAANANSHASPRNLGHVAFQMREDLVGNVRETLTRRHLRSYTSRTATAEYFVSVRDFMTAVSDTRLISKIGDPIKYPREALIAKPVGFLCVA